MDVGTALHRAAPPPPPHVPTACERLGELRGEPALSGLSLPLAPPPSAASSSSVSAQQQQQQQQQQQPLFAVHSVRDPRTSSTRLRSLSLGGAARDPPPLGSARSLDLLHNAHPQLLIHSGFLRRGSSYQQTLGGRAVAALDHMGLRSAAAYLSVALPTNRHAVADASDTQSQTDDADGPVVRCMAAHPHLPLVAFGRRDGTVEVRSPAAGSSRALSHPHGTHLQQTPVLAMAWCPSRNDLLAVGTSQGLFLWQMDDTTAAVRPLSDTPANALCWSPCGLFLLHGSSRGGLYVWDVTMLQKTVVHPRMVVRLLRWSPDGHRVFASAVGPSYHVYETCGWERQSWETHGGSVTAAQWSPCSAFVVYALSGEHALRYLALRDGDATQGIACELPHTIVHDTEGNETAVGGPVLRLAWDCNGERLAAICGASPSAPEPLVVICRTATSSREPTVTPSGFVRGPPNVPIDASHHSPDATLPVDTTFLSGLAPKRGLGAVLLTLWHLPGKGCDATPVPFYFRSTQQMQM